MVWGELTNVGSRTFAFHQVSRERSFMPVHVSIGFLLSPESECCVLYGDSVGDKPICIFFNSSIVD